MAGKTRQLSRTADPAQFSSDHPDTLLSMESLGLLLLETKDFQGAEPVFRECLAIHQKRERDDWRTFNSKSQLGEALLGQKKYTDAEPCLLAGYEGMKQRETTIPTERKICLVKAVARLVQLYEATDKKDEAAKRRQELDTITAAIAPAGEAAVEREK